MRNIDRARRTIARILAACVAGAIQTCVASGLPAQLLRFGAPAVVPIRELSVDNLDEKWAVEKVAQIAVDQRGTMYVWELSDMSIRAYNNVGKPLRVVARKGGGPGELNQNGTMQIIGDTLFVVEHVTNRVSTFALNSGARNTIVVKPKTTAASGVTAKVVGGYLAGVAINDAARLNFSLVTVNDDGIVLATLSSYQRGRKLLSYDLFQEHVKNGALVARVVGFQPLLIASATALTADGRALILADVPVSPIGGNNSIVLTSVNLRGDTNWTRRLPYMPSPITDADLRDVIDSLAKPVLEGRMRVVGDRRLLKDSIVRPANWPPFTGLLAGIDGTVWLKQGGPPSKADRYWRFSPTGVYEANVQMPVGFRLMQASRHQLWGIRTDSEGLATIERYRVM